MELAGKGGRENTYFILQISVPRSLKVTKARKKRRTTIKT